MNLSLEELIVVRLKVDPDHTIVGLCVCTSSLHELSVSLSRSWDCGVPSTVVIIPSSIVFFASPWISDAN